MDMRGRTGAEEGGVGWGMPWKRIFGGGKGGKEIRDPGVHPARVEGDIRVAAVAGLR